MNYHTFVSSPDEKFPKVEVVVVSSVWEIWTESNEPDLEERQL